MRFVDVNGNWPTVPHSYHGDIVHAALDGYLSAGEIAQLVSEQREMDKDQSEEGAYRHFIATPGQSAANAQHESWSFVTTSMMLATSEMGAKGSFTPEALKNFGDALHTVQDFTSPAHTNNQGEPYTWYNRYLFDLPSQIGHVAQETSPAADWSRFGWAIRLTLAAYVEWFPKQAAEKGLTTANLGADANKRISSYVNNYFDSQGYTNRVNPIAREAARLCALGNLAACR